jgi:hypothetical protein
MPCDHKGGPELIAMAEAHLHEQGMPAAEGMKFRWSENLDDSMWASVIVEVERRGEQWIVTRLDRRADKVAETGFESVLSAES